MRIPSLLICILLASMSSPPARAEPPDSTSSAVRVMSFNIRYGTAQDGPNHWQKRREFLTDTVRAFNPDLLGTQETLAFQRDFLAQQLPGFAAWGAGRDDGADQGEMSALFYRTERFERTGGGHFWLSETPEKPGSKSWDGSLPRMVSWVKLRDRRAPEGPSLLFLNTHFDHKGAEARLQAARLLRGRIGELGQGCRVILTGDFNASDDSPPYAALFGRAGDADSPVLDAFRLAHPQRGSDEGTFNGFQPGATSGARIDWIGVSRDWRVTEVRIDRTMRDGRTPSDHFPVCAILSPP